MAFDLSDVTFTGPAMPGPFVLYKLEPLLAKKKLIGRETKAEAKELLERWTVYRRKLRALGERGLEARVLHHVLEPLVEQLGYAKLERAEDVTTREGRESGGYLLRTADGGGHLRAWVVPVGTDIDAPNKRGRAYRFSPALVAQRVLLTKGERIALLTDGEELRIVLSDPSGRDSNLTISLDGSSGWRRARDVPDSFRLLRALCQPAGVQAIGELLDEARLAQSGVTRKLREQTRRAVERFIQGLLDAPENREQRAGWRDLDAVSGQLWREGLILVYRLLFILKLETAADPARSFTFATVSTWRNSYSPSTALAPIVERVRDEGADTGGFLSSSLRALFRLFSEGISSSDLQVSPLGGMLFGHEATPLLDSLHWSETAVAELLDALLWTPADAARGRGRAGHEDRAGRERIHYGTLDVEDLGRVYEALLELEPGVTSEPMCRLRRAKLEVVVSLAQGAPYRRDASPDAEDDEPTDEDDDDDDETAGKGKTKVVFVEEIPANRFYLRVGLGRKASGSYYTPHPFVRFLVQETLGPQIAEQSPQSDPNPLAILGLRVLDPAMGSGHFLVEACRFLGEALYEACRLCDEYALDAQRKADAGKTESDKALHLARARELRKRVEDLPDPNDELLAYLPSRVVDGEESGLSQRKALALCRRLVAVHCLYGVDKNQLAVELARVSLWLESYAEGLPLTFLEHRLICGDSLTGPFFEHLLTFPGTGKPIEEMHTRGISERLTEVLTRALGHVRELEASIGKDVADVELKRLAKQKLDAALAPLKLLAAAWSGGVMLGEESDEMGYEALVRALAEGRAVDDELQARAGLARMVKVGSTGVPFDLLFPEVFHPAGTADCGGGFHAVLGNPPWDAIQFKSKEFLAAFDLAVMDAPTKRESDGVERELLSDDQIAALFLEGKEHFERWKRSNDRLFAFQKVTIDDDLAGRQLDAFRVFMERNAQVVRRGGYTGVVVPSAFHANAGATGVRHLYLKGMRLWCCYSFENSKKIFDIHSSFKFAAVVAQREPTGTEATRCAFYLTELAWLSNRIGELTYDVSFIEHTGGEHLCFPEARSHEDFRALKALYRPGVRAGTVLDAANVRPNTSELPMLGADVFLSVQRECPGADPRKPAAARALLSNGRVPLHEGKTFHQFNDLFGDAIRYVVHLPGLKDRPRWYELLRYYRLAYREVARSTDERTSIAALLPPPTVSTRTAAAEVQPHLRANANALALLSVFNSFPFDFCVRLRVGAHMTRFLVEATAFPLFDRGAIAWRFLAHAALRLSCRHEGYAALWAEQVGEHWREQAPRHRWPILGSDDDRWPLRAAIDAVVAGGYGIDRQDYSHLLSSFSHKSYATAPARCLSAFDELQAIGLEAFTKKHDPYWDVPLVMDLPKPVIDLPVASASTDVEGFALSAPQPKRRTRGRRA